MPSHADTAYSASTNTVTKFLAVVLPLCFCVWQANSMSTNSRITAPALKVSFRVVAVCLVSAALLAANMTRQEEGQTANRRVHSSSSASHENGRGSTSLDGTFVYDRLNWEQMDAAAICSGNLLIHLYGHERGGDPHRLLQVLQVLYQQHAWQMCRVPSQHEVALDQILNECLAAVCSAPRLALTVKRLSTSSSSLVESAASLSDVEGEPTSSTGSEAGRPGWVPSVATNSDSATPNAPLTPMHAPETPDIPSRSSPGMPGRILLYAYRHNPYSFRGYQRVDVGANTTSIPITLRKASGDVAETITVPHDVLLKPQQVPIDLRKRGRGVVPAATDAAAEPTVEASTSAPKGKKNPKSTPAAPAASAAPRTANPLAAARKAMKKAYEQSGMSLQDPLFDINVNVDGEDFVAAETRDESGEDLDTNMTMTGLPNVDGHRVAENLLQVLKARGVIKNTYTFAMNEKRTDRFNTGACHLIFDALDDARRVQQTLRDQLLFASFRNGACVVTTARE